MLAQRTRANTTYRFHITMDNWRNSVVEVCKTGGDLGHLVIRCLTAEAIFGEHIISRCLIVMDSQAGFYLPLGVE